MEMTPQMKEVLDQYALFHTQPVESLDAANARQQSELRDAVTGVINHHSAKRLMVGVVEPVQEVSHITIPGPAGEMLARVYKPRGDGPHPVLLYFHGGGWVIANLNSYDASCRALANSGDCIVVSLAYRQAPEHKYPAAVEDAVAAYQWLTANATTLGGDNERIAVGGESAGGNLAAVLSIICKEEGLPMPIHQLLIYPVTDVDFDTPSYLENADAKPLNRAMMKWFFKQYLPDFTFAADPHVAPLRHSDLTGLPPATVITAEIDPLCSEGEAYAAKLESFGVPVVSRRFDGVTHEFFGMKAVVSEAKDAVALAAEQLQAAFDITGFGANNDLQEGFDAQLFNRPSPLL